MAKKKEEVKEIETTEEKACACGEECKCKKGRARKVIVTILLILSFSVIAFGVGVVTGGFILFGDNDAEVENKDEAKEEATGVYLGSENEYVLLEKKDNLVTGDKFVESLLNFKTVGPNAVTRKEFFATPNFVLSYVGSYYSDAQGDMKTVTKKQNIAEHVETLFGYDLNDGQFSDVESVDITNGYSFGDMTCISEYCYIFAGAGGEMYGPEYVNTVIKQETVGDNTVYTVKEFYMGYGENGVRNIYAEKDGDLLVAASKISTYDELVKVVSTDNLNTYTITFDKEGKFVSCEKVK